MHCDANDLTLYALIWRGIIIVAVLVVIKLGLDHT